MKSNLVKITNSIDIESLPQDSPLQKILLNALGDTNIQERIDSDPFKAYWEASFFGLDQVHVFKELKNSEKDTVLKSCSISLLEEAAYIEKSATCFTAKMTLLSESTEERMLYSLFAAEEVAHHHAMMSYLPNQELPTNSNPFIALLNEVQEEGSKAALTFIIQVVLEGWGLTHFAGLAEACNAQDLRNTFRWFVKHEARHHGSGLVLFNDNPPSSLEIEYIVEIMVRFLRMIQIGPQTVLSNLMKCKGDLSLKDLTQACLAMNCEKITKGKLEKLKSLMYGKHSKSIISKLEDYEAFVPCSPEECAHAFKEWVK